MSRRLDTLKSLLRSWRKAEQELAAYRLGREGSPPDSTEKTLARASYNANGLVFKEYGRLQEDQ